MMTQEEFENLKVGDVLRRISRDQHFGLITRVIKIKHSYGVRAVIVDFPHFVGDYSISGSVWELHEKKSRKTSGFGKFIRSIEGV